MSISPGTRKTASFIAKVTLFNSLVIVIGFTLAGIGFLFFNMGNLPTKGEQVLVGGVFLALAALAGGIAWWAKKRLAKLKELP